jgi:Capsule polysaccharide export protein
MNEPRLDYLGPLSDDGPKTRGDSWAERILRRPPLAFLLVVVVPTFLSLIYFVLIASPLYVSEARFIVRQPGHAQPNSLGLALQGAGMVGTQTDAFAVHEYILSQDALTDLGRRYDMATVLGPRGADVFSRWPRPFQSRSSESMLSGYKRFVTVGYDSTTGISTLRVKAFRPGEAQAVAESLLTGGEGLINRLNERAAADAVDSAERSRVEAQARLASAQQRLVAFRNRERFIDPEVTAQEASRLIGQLTAQVATLRAERSQIAAEAPQSPQLPSLDARINALQRQIADERAKLAGQANSLAPRVSAYEDLQLERQFADRQMVEAASALVEAQEEARRQKLYLERIVNPSRPEQALEPRRWTSVLTVLISTLILYALGWLLLAGLREHRQV